MLFEGTPAESAPQRLPDLPREKRSRAEGAPSPAARLQLAGHEIVFPGAAERNHCR